MERQFHSHGESHSASQDGDEETTAQRHDATEDTWPLANEIQQLLGDDSELDPLFFEESWTLGLDAAVQHCQQKRDESVRREQQSRAFRELDNLGTLPFTQDAVQSASFLHRTGVETAVRCYGADWLQESSEEAASRMNSPGLQNCAPSTRMCDNCQVMLYPVTEHHARQLLGVTETSSAPRIKAAYRRMVNQWHPDRIEHGNEEARHFATEQMAAINAAYFLLHKSYG